MRVQKAVKNKNDETPWKYRWKDIQLRSKFKVSSPAYLELVAGFENI